MKPIVWSIAGSDSGGGAGIQADLKVMHEIGVHGCSVITALTAQNTLGVTFSETVSPKMLLNQLLALSADLAPVVIKTGMLGSAENCRIITEFLTDFISKSENPPKIVCDPVLKSTSGANLTDPDALKYLQNNFSPLIDLLTPNIPEAEVLLGRDLSVEESAKELLKFGVKSVLIKGGHADGDICRDFFYDGTESLWFESPRVETTATHGTGCVLSSAIAAFIALGDPVPAAIFKAKELLTQKLKCAGKIGLGHGPFV